MIQNGLSLAFASLKQYTSSQSKPGPAPAEKQAPVDKLDTQPASAKQSLPLDEAKDTKVLRQRNLGDLVDQKLQSFAKELQAGAAGVQVSASYAYSGSGESLEGLGLPTTLSSGFLSSLNQADAGDDVNPVDFQFQQSVSASGFGGFGGTGEFSFSFEASISASSASVQFGYSFVFQGSVAQPSLGAEQPEAPVDDVVAQPPVADTPPVDAEPTSTVSDDAPVTTPPVADDAPIKPPVVDDAPAPVLRKRVYSDSVSSSQRFENVVQKGPGDKVTQLDAQDFAKLRAVEKTKSLETSLQLELKTNDGDVISLDFSQIDTLVKNRFNGRTLDGDRIRSLSVQEDLQRAVNISVEGDISAEEQEAIDKVIGTVIEVANAFFTGSTGAAVEKLQSLDFDGEQLAQLSLDLSLKKSVSVSKAYQQGADALQDLSTRDRSVAQVLEFLATEQKRLVDVAKEVLDPPSAAKLVRSLVPVLTSDPFAKLSEEFSGLNDVQQKLSELDALPSRSEDT